MLNDFELYLTYENIYLLSNWGVVPFWLMLLFIPNHSITKIFVHSIIVPLLLSVAYSFVAYKIYLTSNIFESFNLYLSLDSLYSLFSDEAFLLIFWLHFLALSLFVGGWISRDSQKYMIPKIFTFFALVITYFTGPIGLVFYWFVRIFFAKKIGFND